MLDLTIASDILAFTKPPISQYYRFRLQLSSEANIFCVDKATVPVILTVEYTSGVKVSLRSRQA